MREHNSSVLPKAALQRATFHQLEKAAGFSSTDSRDSLHTALMCSGRQRQLSVTEATSLYLQDIYLELGSNEWILFRRHMKKGFTLGQKVNNQAVL